MNAPKRSLSAYFLFLSDFRKKHPELALTETSRKAGEAWKALSVAKKAPYEKQAEKDKKRYLKEKEAYMKTDDYTDYQETLARFMKKKAKAQASWSELMGGEA